MTARQFIRDYYDKKHPILHRLRANMGVGLDEVEKLLEEYAQQLAPLSDAVEFVRWKDRRYNKERKGYVLRKVYANNPSLANVKYWSVEELYEQFKSEQPAQIATDDDRRFTLKEMLEYGKAARFFSDSGFKYGNDFATPKEYFKCKFNIDL